MPKLSIIIPVYNAEKYLEKCINSVLKQTFQNFELILIDDGSTDISPKICDEYERKDVRVKVIHQTNSGAAAARNRGLKIATGEYITFVDSDDYIDAIMYEKMIHTAIQYDCDLIVCDCIKEHGQTSNVYTHNIRGGYYNEQEFKEEYFPKLLIMPEIQYPVTISNWVCMIKNTVIKGMGIRYEEGIRFSEDWLFGAQVALYSKNFYYMKNECYYHYRMNDNSVTHIFKIDKWDHYKKLYTKFKNVFGEYKEYDFENQIYKVLLFFVYNAVGDILFNRTMSYESRICYAKKILGDDEVKAMFEKIKISALNISLKMKIQTMMYKYEWGLGLLCAYIDKKER